MQPQRKARRMNSSATNQPGPAGTGAAPMQSGRSSGDRAMQQPAGAADAYSTHSQRTAAQWAALVAGLIARLLVGGLFILAAVMKLLDPEAFAKDIRNYAILPAAWSNVAAMTLPWLELVTGALLIVGVWRGAARCWLVLMLVGFTALKLTLVFRGLPLECGCFGHGNPLSDALGKLFSGVPGLWLNVAMLALLGLDAWCCRVARGRRTVRPTAPAA